jgi:hypothetical protein
MSTTRSPSRSGSEETGSRDASEPSGANASGRRPVFAPPNPKPLGVYAPTSRASVPSGGIESSSPQSQCTALISRRRLPSATRSVAAPRVLVKLIPRSPPGTRYAFVHAIGISGSFFSPSTGPSPGSMPESTCPSTIGSTPSSIGSRTRYTSVSPQIPASPATGASGEPSPRAIGCAAAPGATTPRVDSAPCAPWCAIHVSPSTNRPNPCIQTVAAASSGASGSASPGNRHPYRAYFRSSAMSKACVDVRIASTGLPVFRYASISAIWSSGRSRSRVNSTMQSASRRCASPGMLPRLSGLTTPVSASTENSTVHRNPCRALRIAASCGSDSSDRYSSSPLIRTTRFPRPAAPSGVSSVGSKFNHGAPRACAASSVATMNHLIRIRTPIRSLHPAAAHRPTMSPDPSVRRTPAPIASPAPHARDPRERIPQPIPPRGVGEPGPHARNRPAASFAPPASPDARPMRPTPASPRSPAPEGPARDRPRSIGARKTADPGGSAARESREARPPQRRRRPITSPRPAQPIAPASGIGIAVVLRFEKSSQPSLLRLHWVSLPSES